MTISSKTSTNTLCVLIRLSPSAQVINLLNFWRLKRCHRSYYRVSCVRWRTKSMAAQCIHSRALRTSDGNWSFHEVVSLQHIVRKFGTVRSRHPCACTNMQRRCTTSSAYRACYSTTSGVSWKQRSLHRSETRLTKSYLVSYLSLRKLRPMRCVLFHVQSLAWAYSLHRARNEKTNVGMGNT